MDSLIAELLHEVESAEDCLDFCQSNSDCEFFTFYGVDHSCLNLVNCVNFASDTCSECYSGDRNCEGMPLFFHLF